MTSIQMTCGDLLNVVEKVLQYTKEIRGDRHMRRRDIESLDLAEVRAIDLKQLCEFGKVFDAPVYLSLEDYSWICMYINKDKLARSPANPEDYRE